MVSLYVINGIDAQVGVAALSQRPGWVQRGRSKSEHGWRRSSDVMGWLVQIADSGYRRSGSGQWLAASG